MNVSLNRVSIDSSRRALHFDFGYRAVGGLDWKPAQTISAVIQAIEKIIFQLAELIQ